MKRFNQIGFILRNFFASKWFFIIAVVWLTVGASYIALTSLYPMAFDEEFHYGLIQIFATSLLPFGIEHTSDMAQYGPATADASYLFHYLFSFPYRALNFIGLTDQLIIILLRLLNIGLVVLALVLFRNAFLEAGVSRAITHVSLALFVGIPIFPFLAAQINYDNLLLPLVAWCVLLIMRLTQSVRSTKQLNPLILLQLSVAVLIGMSVKYAFLPIALAFFIWMLFLASWALYHNRKNLKKQLRTHLKSWKQTPRKSKQIWLGLLALSLFFASHYITNLVSYGDPIPTCDQVFTETECKAYGPWNRNRLLVANKSPSFEPLSFPAFMSREWFPGMAKRLTFAVAGKTNDFQTKQPLPVLFNLYVWASILGLVALGVVLITQRMTWFWAFTLLVVAIYCGSLAFKLYGSYVYTSEPVAINGRYLLPILPLVTVTLMQAISIVLRSVPQSIIAILTTLFLIISVVAGAGIGTYIVQSERHWYWPGFGQSTYEAVRPLGEQIILPYRRN